MWEFVEVVSNDAEPLTQQRVVRVLMRKGAEGQEQCQFLFFPEATESDTIENAIAKLIVNINDQEIKHAELSPSQEAYIRNMLLEKWQSGITIPEIIEKIQEL